MLATAVRSPMEGRPMVAFTYRLEHADGTPAEPAILKTAVPDWKAGDTIPLGRDRTLRVVGTRLDQDDPVLVVERA